MMKKSSRTSSFFATIMVCIMLISAIAPAALATNTSRIKGFDKGPSYKPVVPMKKVTMVNFDENSYLDDYAYLAAVPTAVFKDGDKLFSNPLLYYQDSYPVKEDKERSLNARQGLDYFMDDWMSYCNGQLDQMTLINVPKEKVEQWSARNVTVINGSDPYSIASKIALHEWSYSNDAVVAVINESFKEPNTVTKEILKGSISPYEIGHQHFEMEEPVIGTGGTYKSFKITDSHYKYIVARLSWPNKLMDLDLQLYDSKLGMVDNVATDFAGQAAQGPVETTGSYIHNYGKWEVSVTAVPKKGMPQGISDNKQGKLLNDFSFKELARMLKNMGEVDIWMYPGVITNIASTPFGCRDATFKLTWGNPSVHLGFALLDPVDNEICSSLSEGEITSGEIKESKRETSIHVGMLGECRTGENYSICVFSIDDVPQPVDFQLDYSWQQNFSRDESDCFVSATNGAVLASKLNAPLLYIKPSEIPKSTSDVLYKLGVENIYLVSIGSHLSSNAQKELEEISVITEYNKPRQICNAIKDPTFKSDIIFTTIDPWTYWYVTELKPAGEYPGGLFVGPAAYIAAQHGSPVLIVDEHPRLSQAIAYHTNFWKKYVSRRVRFEPSSGSMVLSGREVYDFLEDYGLGKLEDGGAAHQIQEKIITVAGQYDIGTSWDRMFTGAARPGRFWGSPVDTAYAICRNVFYPALIFANPATGDIRLINASSSKIERIGGRLKDPRGVDLVITKPSKEKEFEYPVLHTYNTFAYKFNEKAWKQWDFKYTRADGIIPYVTDSLDPIDDGVTDKAGAYYPDLSESEVIPFYAKRAGYDNVFSTDFSTIVENLNRGVLIWVEECHGYHTQGGKIAMWDKDSPYVYEKDPWRAYEPVMYKLGHLRTYLHWYPYYIYNEAAQSNINMEKAKEISQIRPVKLQLFSEIGCTENPDVALINPQLIILNKIIKPLKEKIHFNDLWGAGGVMVYRDRILHPLETMSKNLPFVNIYQGDGKVAISHPSGVDLTEHWTTGYEFDDALKNLHSCGINTISCMPALTYLHLTWMRHGMTYEIIDPWSTSDWSGIWNQMLIKLFAMGDTLGQAYEKGMRACGPEFLVGQWWWDKLENVELFGDPSLRVLVPGTDYSDANYWQEGDTIPLRYDAGLSVNGHMPFGATGHPHEKSPGFWQQYSLIVVSVVIVVAFVGVVLLFSSRYKRRRREK